MECEVCFCPELEYTPRPRQNQYLNAGHVHACCFTFSNVLRRRPLVLAGSCWSQLLRGESDGRRWTCPPLSHSPPGRWERTSRASSPADEEWSETQRDSGRSERSLRSDQKSWRRSRDRENTRSAFCSGWNHVSDRLSLLPAFYLQLFPTSMSLRTSSVHFTSLSCSPTTCTCCFPSSRTRNLALRFSRSNTFRYKCKVVMKMPHIITDGSEKKHFCLFSKCIVWTILTSSDIS